MSSLAELQSRRERLAAARAEGVRSVGFGEDRVDFKSDAEMAAALAALDREIVGLQGKRINTFYPHFSKGV